MAETHLQLRRHMAGTLSAPTGAGTVAELVASDVGATFEVLLGLGICVWGAAATFGTLRGS